MTTQRRVSSRGPALRVLLLNAIDYAGLFPPAQLDVPGAVAEYASYLESDDRWALGRFVVPASRLDELAIAAADLESRQREPSLGSGPWPLSALLGSDIPHDLKLVRAFNVAHADDASGWSATVEAIEVRASSVDAIADAMRVIGDDVECFIEIPIASDPTSLVRAIGAAGARAKVRTGGTTADAFPTSADLARFLGACVKQHVAFKATAGLHHPLRGQYSLTYAAESERGTMYGFLNVFLAAALLQAGASEETAAELLEERESGAFEFGGGGLTWRGYRVTSEQLATTREVAMTSFGSCSFREPLDDLGALGLLP